jgi:hypothetical protein
MLMNYRQKENEVINTEPHNPDKQTNPTKPAKPDKYDFRYNNELTKYPELYEYTSWGSDNFNREDIVIETRNRFPKAYDIKRHEGCELITSSPTLYYWYVQKKYPEKYWYLFNPIECYIDKHNQYVFLITPYKAPINDIMWLEKLRWKQCGHMLYPRYPSYIKKISTTFIEKLREDHDDYLRKENMMYEERERLHQEELRRYEQERIEYQKELRRLHNLRNLRRNSHEY